MSVMCYGAASILEVPNVSSLRKEEFINALSEFKQTRDAMLHADREDFRHHLIQFVAQLDHNPLCIQALAGSATIDPEAWMKAQTEDTGDWGIQALNLPTDPDERLAIFSSLTRSFAKEERTNFSIHDFGSAFRKYGHDESRGMAQSLILRPFCSELTARLRERMEMANPDIRELAGVPLDRIPSDNDLGVFLSHKSRNKDVVRQYHRVLQAMGYRPWLDEDAMTAGDVLHRELAGGMENSCAAVFFVTKDFSDERWLRREIDLAVTRQVERGSKFQIITLVFDGAEVPKPLQQYLFQHVADHLDGLREIIRALPIELGPARWRERVVSERRKS